MSCPFTRYRMRVRRRRSRRMPPAPKGTSLAARSSSPCRSLLTFEKNRDERAIRSGKALVSLAVPYCPRPYRTMGSRPGVAQAHDVTIIRGPGLRESIRSVLRTTCFTGATSLFAACRDLRVLRLPAQQSVGVAIEVLFALVAGPDEADENKSNCHCQGDDSGREAQSRPLGEMDINDRRTAYQDPGGGQRGTYDHRFIPCTYAHR